jgi:hypothetical protein
LRFLENFITVKLNISTLKDSYAICKLDPNSDVPGWAQEGDFYSISRTTNELSIICDRRNIPENVNCEHNWRVLMIEGPFEFGEIGILNSITKPLAEAKISLLTISTFDTDYILIKEIYFAEAIKSLENAGHIISD